MPKKKAKEVPSMIVSPPPYTAEENESRYNKDYGFNKPVSVRSPAMPWEDKYIRNGQSGAPPKEVSMVKGTPYSRKGVRLGNSYGNRPATRKVGK